MWDMFNRYPYINLTDRNLDLLTKAIREMQDEVKNFVSLNAVKYANPIQWNINKQYEKNTIVIDPLTGTAFISVQPVPSGVSLTRTQYWTVVFDLSRFVTKAASNFANSYERDITTTATMPTGAGDWVVWDSTLYVALNAIHAGDAYVVGGNIKRMTVEDFYDLLMDAIRNLDEELDTEIRNRTKADETLQDNIDAEVLAREGADTTLQHNIDTEAQARVESINTEIQARSDADIALSNALNGRIDTLINKLKNDFIIVTDFNLDNTGVTECGSTFQSIINAHPNRTYVFPDGIYDFNSYQIEGNVNIVGVGNAILKNFNWRGSSEEYISNNDGVNGSQFTAENLTFASDNSDYALYLTSAQQREFIRTTRVHNCKFYGRNALTLHYLLSVYVESCDFLNNAVAINCVSSTNLIFTDNYFLSPSIGVNIEPISTSEPRMGGETFNFTNCMWYNGVTAIRGVWASNIQLTNCMIDYFDCGLDLRGCRECKVVSSYIGVNKNGSKAAWGNYIEARRNGAIYAEMYSEINWWSSVWCLNSQFVTYDSAQSSAIIFDGGEGAIKGVTDSRIQSCKFDNYSNNVATLIYARNVSGLYLTDNMFVSVEHPVSYSYNYETSSCDHVVNLNNNYSKCLWQGVAKAPNVGNIVYPYIETHQVTLSGNGSQTTNNTTITFNNIYGGVPKVILQPSNTSAGIDKGDIIPILVATGPTTCVVSARYSSILTSDQSITLDVIVIRDIGTFN